MSKIGVDVDNTLYSFEQAARQAYMDLAKERGDKSLFKGAYNPWTEWRSMEDTCGDDVCGSVIERVHAPEIIAQQVPYPESSSVLWDLVNEGHHLIYISNRHPKSQQATSDWLDDHLFPEGELSCSFDDKIPQVRGCQYMIDDRPKTLVQFVHNYQWHWHHPEESRIGFGLAFPYNQALTDVPGIYLAPVWSGIRHYLRDRGVLSA